MGLERKFKLKQKVKVKKDHVDKMPEQWRNVVKISAVYDDSYGTEYSILGSQGSTTGISEDRLEAYEPKTLCAYENEDGLIHHCSKDSKSLPHYHNYKRNPKYDIELNNEN